MLRTAWLQQFAVTLRQGGMGRRHRRRARSIPVHPAHVELLETRVMLSGTEAETTESYDYATFAETMFDHAALPALGDVIAYVGVQATLPAQLNSDTSAFDDDFTSDGDTTTTTTADPDGGTTVVTNTWSESLTKTVDEELYSELFTSDYTITTTWNNGEGEAYTLTQTGTHEYLLTVTLPSVAGGPTLWTFSESQVDGYTHTRTTLTDTTDADGNNVLVDATYHSDGLQIQTTTAGKVDKVEHGDREGFVTITAVEESYDLTSTETVTSPDGTTVTALEIADGGYEWEQTESDRLFEALGEGDDPFDPANY